MANIVFEFVVNGPPYSGNRDESKPKTQWKQEVGQAAYAQWIADALDETLLPLTMPLEVFVTTYCTNKIWDVDNVLKWTLDGMSVKNRPLVADMNTKQQKRAATYQSLYQDDVQIYRITSERIDVRTRLSNIRSGRDTLEASSLVLEMMEREDISDFLHITLSWKESEE